jgi:signal transduction histidine kinase
MKTFRSRVFILILIPTVLIFLLITFTGLYYFNTVLKEQAISKKQLELELTTRSVDDWLISRISDLVLLSRARILSENDMSEIKKVLIDEQHRLSFLYEKFWIIMPQGDYWNTDNETGNMAGHKILNSFIIRDRYLSYIIPDNDDSIIGNSIILAVPIYQADILRQVLCVTVPFQWFSRVILNFTSSFFDEILVVDPSGTIISHKNSELIGKRESDIFHRVFSVYTELEKSHVFISTLKNNWKLVGIINKENLLHQITKTIQFAMGLIFGSLLVIALVTFAITRIVANPIRILTEGVKRVMRGDYGQKIVINSTNEINTLANTFNKMNQQLIKSRTDDRFTFLGHISARMAHEIRKPMNIIQLIAEAVRKRGEFREEDYHAIVQEIQNADRFVREIYEFVKPEDLSLSLYSLRKLILTVIQKFELKLVNKNIQIITELQQNTPEFYIDIFRMEQVLSNLINNSIQAIKENGRIDVFLNQSENSNKTILEISDSGPGISEDIIDKIFDPYFSTKDDGIGIGLSISYRILMSHGAKIEAFNQEKGGLLIQITFLNIG